MGLDGLDGMGWDLCAGLLYEHRFAMLIIHIPIKNNMSSCNICTRKSDQNKLHKLEDALLNKC